ncbi:hypothetical protein EW146_g8904 [Bondarzewia mesenterica]|uniref:Uncharacterized protein n=1 Tax=Bondarzewia mesenterica TaxID=1095465 RepID=A0A4S4LAZ9_9AGAM|nr:hypothetical protein EW146_g8904 [Bondarzewia mesenterica]
MITAQVKPKAIKIMKVQQEGVNVKVDFMLVTVLDQVETPIALEELAENVHHVDSAHLGYGCIEVIGKGMMKQLQFGKWNEHKENPAMTSKLAKSLQDQEIRWWVHMIPVIVKCEWVEVSKLIATMDLKEKVPEVEWMEAGKAVKTLVLKVIGQLDQQLMNAKVKSKEKQKVVTEKVTRKVQLEKERLALPHWVVELFDEVLQLLEAKAVGDKEYDEELAWVLSFMHSDLWPLSLVKSKVTPEHTVDNDPLAQHAQINEIDAVYKQTLHHQYEEIGTAKLSVDQAMVMYWDGVLAWCKDVWREMSGSVKMKVGQVKARAAECLYFVLMQWDPQEVVMLLMMESVLMNLYKLLLKVDQVIQQVSSSSIVHVHTGTS